MSLDNVYNVILHAKLAQLLTMINVYLVKINSILKMDNV